MSVTGVNQLQSKHDAAKRSARLHTRASLQCRSNASRNAAIRTCELLFASRDRTCRRWFDRRDSHDRGNLRSPRRAPVRFFRQPHRGVSAALNFGLVQIRGELVARLDSDDLWHPTKLERQVELLATDSTVALAYTFVRYVDDTGRIVRDAAPQRLAGRALCQCLCNGIIGGGSSVVFRRSILDSVGGYERVSASGRTCWFTCGLLPRARSPSFRSI